MEIVISLLIGILIMEGYAWLDAFAKWLLERAVSQISAEDQERCREEWKADLDAMPNTAWKLVYALRNFSTTAAERINADLCEAKWDKIQDELDEMVTGYQVVVEQFREIKLFRGQSRKKREELRRSVDESASSLRSADWPNGKPNEQMEISFLNAVSAFERLGNSLIEATERPSNLLVGSIEGIGANVERLDPLVKFACAKRDQINELLQHRSLSSGDLALLTSLEKCLMEINHVHEEVAGDDPALKEHDKIIAVLENVTSSMTKS
jgi:hypothetical protein